MSELVSFDDFSTRECRYFRSSWGINNGFGCAHPKQEDVDDDELPSGRVVTRGRCYFFSCPRGAAVNPHTEPLDADMLRRIGLNPDDYGDGELLLLTRRRPARDRQTGAGHE